MNKKRMLNLLAALLCLMMVCACAVAEDGGDASCAHANMSTPQQILGETTFIPNGESGHTRSTAVSLVSTCPDCGHSESVSSNPINTEQVHKFGGGECSECHYVCQHPESKMLFEDFMDTDCKDNGDGTHTVTYIEPFEVRKCDACGKQYEVPTTMGPDIEDHDFEDGECFCGAKDTCEHTNRTPDHQGMTNETYEKLNSEQHTVHYIVLQVYTCDDCGSMFDVNTGEKASTTKNHTFKNGKCEDCKYCKHERHDPETGACSACGESVGHNFSTGTCTCGKQCPHSETTATNGTPVTTYAYKNTANHTKTVTTPVTTTCNACGNENTSENVVTADEAHSFQNGVCSATGCGYECAHGETTETNGTPETTYAQKDAENHTKTVKTPVTTTCNDCGTVTGTSENVTTADEAHSFQDGVCTATGCGYACQHGSTSQSTGSETTTTYAPENNDVHRVIVSAPVTTSCAVCNKALNTEYQEQRTTYEEHTFSNGVCTATGCGYECQHPHNMLTLNKEKSWEEALPSVPENENTHTDYYIIHDVFDCACGKEFAPPANQNSAPGKPHNFVNGVCSACKYSNICEHDWIDATCTAPKTCSLCQSTEGEPLGHDFSTGTCSRCGTACPHSETTATDGTPVTTYAPKDAANHTKTVTTPVTTTCKACGAETGTSEKVTTTDEAHSFVDGVCSVTGCGYACEHGETTATDGTSVTTYAQKDAEYHTKTVTTPVTTTCKACGKEMGTSEKVTTADEAHSFVDGKCSASGCGYACEHGETTETNGTPVTAYAPKDAEYHTKTVTTPVTTTCKACGKEVGTSSTVTTADEAHSFQDGVCSATGCGYACVHGSTSQSTGSETTTYAQENNDVHRVIVSVPVTTSCNACGKVLSTENQEQRTTYEEHTFSDGVCSVSGCGYVCQHPQKMLTYNKEESWEEGLPSVPENEKTHTDYYIVHDVFDCACGKEFAPPADQNSAPGQPHTFVDGKCSACDYACQHTDLTVVKADVYKMAEGSKWTSDGNGNHTAKASFGTEYECIACGESVFKGGAEQVHSLPCDKEGDTTLEVEYQILTGGTLDMDKAHRKISKTVYMCSVCEYEFSAVTTGDVEEAHHYNSESACSYCKHACAHSSRRPTDVNDPSKQYDTLDDCVKTDDYTHKDYYTNYTEVTCSTCGKVYFEGTPGVSPELNHTFTDGVCTGCKHACPHPGYNAQNLCTICGKAKPAPSYDYDDDDDDNRGSSSSSNSGSSYRPSYVETPVVNTPVVTTPVVEEVVQAPIASEPVAPAPMVEKLVEAVAAAQESGSTVTVEVVGAKEVMTEAEYTELKTLNVQEQILVTLASVGFEDVVSAAMETMQNVTISEQAQTLMASVSERMVAATPQEKAELESKLNEYFPTREIEVDGVSYPYFILELEVEIDGELSMQRYGFRMDENGEWIFVMLREEDF